METTYYHLHERFHLYVSIESKRNGNQRSKPKASTSFTVSIESKRNGNRKALFEEGEKDAGFNRI